MRDKINKSKSQTYFFNRSNVIKKNPVIYIENNWNVKKSEKDWNVIELPKKENW